jgi:hypothetical protein
MSVLFGSLRQMGYVVRDIEAAMRHWVDVCGVGPWFYADRLPLTAFTYRGTRHDDLHVSVALANSGDVQIELIQQRCSTLSMYREFLAAGHEGLQHWSSWPEDYEARLERALANGYSVGQAGESPRGPFVYFAPGGSPRHRYRDGATHPCAPPHLRPDPHRRPGLGRPRSHSTSVAHVRGGRSTSRGPRQGRGWPQWLTRLQ